VSKKRLTFVALFLAIDAGVVWTVWKQWGALSTPSRSPQVVRVQFHEATSRQIAENAKRASDGMQDMLGRESRQVDHLLATTQPITPLNFRWGGVYVDPAGMSWFQASLPEDLIKQSVEDAFAGRSRLIVGRIHLVDSRGRFWVSPSAGTQPSHTILCYDGKQWLEHEIRAGPNDAIEIVQNGWEDSGGNVWFVVQNASKSQVQVHRFGTDGKWLITTPPPSPSKQHARRGAFWEDVQLIEWPRGTPAFFSPEVYRADVADASTAPRLYRFIDGGWQPVLARACWDHPIHYVMPFSDGRVATICTDHRLFITSEPLTDEALFRELQELDNPEPEVREAAARSLSTLGPDNLPAMRQGLSTVGTPGARSMLQDLIAQLEHRAANVYEDNGPPHPPTMEALGFTYSKMFYIGMDHQGRYLLDVNDYRTGEGKVLRHVLLTLDRDGKPSVAPLPREWTSDLCGENTTLPGEVHIGWDESIWLQDGRRYKDGVLQRVLPPPPGSNRKLDDRDGHVFCENGVMVNLLAPSTQPASKGG
jgi:hypothetical protein